MIDMAPETAMRCARLWQARATIRSGASVSHIATLAAFLGRGRRLLPRRGLDMARLDIVSPVFNEAESATAFAAMVADLAAEVMARHGMSVHTILVDDGSTDDSVARLSTAFSGSWEIVRLSRNFGKEVAVLAGLDRSSGDMVLIMDADMQHSREVSLTMIGELVANPKLDVVYAQTDRSDTSFRRSQLARLFYRLLNSGQRFDIPANAGDFRVMRGFVAKAFAGLREKRRFNKGLYAWAGFRQKAVVYSVPPRRGGVSKWSRLSLIALTVEGLTSFSVVPLRFFSVSGLMIAAGGGLYGAKILLEVLFTGIQVPGYPSLLVAIVVLGGFNLALLGLVGEYVWVALSESKDRPVYVVRDVVTCGAAAEPQHVPDRIGA